MPWRLDASRPDHAAALAATPPTPEEAQRRLASIRPTAYAQTRNRLDGAVTRLSPYITHGLLPLSQALLTLHRRHHLAWGHTLIREFAWRAYFRHVWRHAGDTIFSSLGPGPLPDEIYADALPDDVRRAGTGLAPVDQAVRTLYATGTLHNHARLWLASYLVHVRKVHWRIGADWMWAHLLDGDLASNHLSWQWVAGTASRKPYLFNSENVARYAPAHWHCEGTALDVDYAALEQLARSPQTLDPPRQRGAGISPPAVFGTPPRDSGFDEPDPDAIAGRDVWLLHPWSLASPPAGVSAIVLIDTDFHRRWPWSALRWAWLMGRLDGLDALRWAAPARDWSAALARARTIRGVADPHLGTSGNLPGLHEPAPVFVEPAHPCASFSAWWSRLGGYGPAIASLSSPLENTP